MQVPKYCKQFWFSVSSCLHDMCAAINGCACLVKRASGRALRNTKNKDKKTVTSWFPSESAEITNILYIKDGHVRQPAIHVLQCCAAKNASLHVFSAETSDRSE